VWNSLLCKSNILSKTGRPVVRGLPDEESLEESEELEESESDDEELDDEDELWLPWAGWAGGGWLIFLAGAAPPACDKAAIYINV